MLKSTCMPENTSTRESHEKEQQEIVMMDDEGIAQGRIAKKFGVEHHTVANTLTQWRATNINTDHPQSGRPTILDCCGRIILSRYASDHPHTLNEDIIAHLHTKGYRLTLATLHWNSSNSTSDV